MAEYFLYKKAKLDADEGWTLIMDLTGFEARHIPYCDLRVVRVSRLGTFSPFEPSPGNVPRTLFFR